MGEITISNSVTAGTYNM